MSLTADQAGLAIVACSIMGDGEASDAEQTYLRSMSSHNPLFRNMSVLEFKATIESTEMATTKIGWKAWCAKCAELLPTHYVSTIFSLAVDFSFLDGKPAPSSSEVIEGLKDILRISDDQFGNIVQVLSWKNGIVE